MRLRLISDVGEQWYKLGQLEKSRTLFAEGLRVTGQMPEKKKYKRAYFASRLVLVNPDAAREIARDFKGVRPGRRAAGRRWPPADGTRPLRWPLRYHAMGRLQAREATFGAIASALATDDPARTRRVMGQLPVLDRHRHLVFAHLALAEKNRDKAACRRLLDEELQYIDRHLKEQPEGFGLLSPEKCCRPSSGSTRPSCPNSSGARWPRGSRSTIRGRSRDTRPAT